MFISECHCVESVGIQSFCGPYFPVFGLNTYSVRMRENMDQKNSEYGHFSRNVQETIISKISKKLVQTDIDCPHLQNMIKKKDDKAWHYF